MRKIILLNEWDEYCHGYYNIRYHLGTLKTVGLKNKIIVCRYERNINGLIVSNAAEYVYFLTDKNAEIVSTGFAERDH